VFEPPRLERTIHHDAGRDVVTAEWLQDSGRYRFDDIDLTVRTVTTERYTIRPDDPLSACAEVAWTARVERGAWQIETRTRSVRTATREEFRVAATLDALEADAPVFSRSWDRAIPRDLV
jgi:hypothetical protein